MRPPGSLGTGRFTQAEGTSVGWLTNGGICGAGPVGQGAKTLGSYTISLRFSLYAGWLGAAAGEEEENGGDEGGGGGEGVEAEGAGEEGEGDASEEAKSGNEKDKSGEPGAFMQRRKHTQVLHDTRRVLMSLVEQRRSGVGGIMRGRPRLCPSARAAPLRGRGEGQSTTRGPISRAAGNR